MIEPAAFCADDRLQNRADQTGFSFAELEICQSQTDDGVVCPRVNTPVHEGGLHGKISSFCGGRSNTGHWCNIMGDRLRNTPEYQSYTHAGAKEHGKPGHSTVFRAGIIGTKTDLTPLAERNEENKDHEEQHSGQIQPTELFGQEVIDRIRDDREAFIERYCPESDASGQQQGQSKDKVIDVGFFHQEISFPVIVDSRKAHYICLYYSEKGSSLSKYSS